MERNANSILAGTLLISLLFSPGIRSNTPEVTPQQNEGATGKRPPRPLTVAAAGGELSLEDRKRITKDAKEVYRREFEGVIEGECEKGNRKPEAKASASATSKGITDEHESDKIGCQLSLNNFVIALLPDPVHTHLALGFDRGIDAIEEGLQDERYLFVDSKMPWDPKTHPESEDHVEREATEVAQEAREEQPGLMVFRAQNEGDANPLIVLVVSEAPTTGINKKQFQHAVGVVEKYIGADPHREAKLTLEQRTELWHTSQTSPGLRILGPTFSGSLKSLLDLLQCQDQPSVKPAACLLSHGQHSQRYGKQLFRDQGFRPQSGEFECSFCEFSGSRRYNDRPLQGVFHRQQLRRAELRSIHDCSPVGRRIGLRQLGQE